MNRMFLLADGSGLRVRRRIPLFAFQPDTFVVERCQPCGRWSEEGWFPGAHGELLSIDPDEHRRQQEEASREAMRFARSFLCDESTELTRDVFEQMFPCGGVRAAGGAA